jgi:hypothetical protein
MASQEDVVFDIAPSYNLTFKANATYIASHSEEAYNVRPYH